VVHIVILTTLLAAAPTPAPASAPKSTPARAPTKSGPTSEPVRVESIKIELTNPEQPSKPDPLKVEVSKDAKNGIDAIKIDSPAIEGVKVPASKVETPRAAASKLEPRLVEVVIPVRVVARNQMGRRFRLVEARFVLGGTEIGKVTAPAGQEADLYSPVMVLPLRRGEHALTVNLVFQGRNVGPFSYLGNYRYNVESTYSFYLEHTTRQPIIEVVAREQGGMLTPLERRPTLDIISNVGSGVTPMTGVTHGTEVTVVR
jgi:hypothetical protein